MKPRSSHKPFRRLGIIITVVLWAATMEMPVQAADASVTYEGNAQDFVFTSGTSNTSEDLFPNLKNVYPGDILTQKITVRNDTSTNAGVKIFLRSTGVEAGSEKFLSQLQLTVEETKATEIFADAPSKTGTLTDWVCLGTFAPGTEEVLNLKLEVPITMDDSFQNAAGTIGWEFMAQELSVTPEEPKPDDQKPDDQKPGTPNQNGQKPDTPNQDGQKPVNSNTEIGKNQVKTGDTTVIWIPTGLLLASLGMLLYTLVKKKHYNG